MKVHQPRRLPTKRHDPACLVTGGKATVSWKQRRGTRQRPKRTATLDASGWYAATGVGALTTAILVDQQRLGANARSTVGTVTDVFEVPQGLLLDVSRVEDNTILFVTHDVSEAVYLADTVYVLSHRPAQILHRVDIPFFEVRDISLKSSSEFRAVEKRLLEMLYSTTQPA